MRVTSGDITKRISFVARGASGSFQTGLTVFTVAYSKEGLSSVAVGSVLVFEPNATLQPGVYWLTLNAGTTLQTNQVNEEVIYTISNASMETVHRVIEVVSHL